MVKKQVPIKSRELLEKVVYLFDYTTYKVIGPIKYPVIEGSWSLVDLDDLIKKQLPDHGPVKPVGEYVIMKTQLTPGFPMEWDRDTPNIITSFMAGPDPEKLFITHWINWEYTGDIRLITHNESIDNNIQLKMKWREKESKYIKMKATKLYASSYSAALEQHMEIVKNYIPIFGHSPLLL